MLTKTPTIFTKILTFPFFFVLQDFFQPSSLTKFSYPHIRNKNLFSQQNSFNIYYKGVIYMQSCDLVITISALACNIAKDKTIEEIALLASIFTQLGDTLDTIAAQKAMCTPSDSN